jgi:hypothetical protein
VLAERDERGSNLSTNHHIRSALRTTHQRLLRVQRSEAEPDHSPSSAEVSDVWRFVVHLYACVVWFGTLASNLLIPLCGAGCGRIFFVLADSRILQKFLPFPAGTTAPLQCVQTRFGSHTTNYLFSECQGLSSGLKPLHLVQGCTNLGRTNLLGKLYLLKYRITRSSCWFLYHNFSYLTNRLPQLYLWIVFLVVDCQL